MSYSDLLKDPRWQKKRLEIFQRDSFACQSCLDTESTLHVHHLKYVGLPWECPDNFLVTLCEQCHEREEELKKHDIYDLICDYGITRIQIHLLISHIKFSMSISEDPRPFWAFNEVLRKIVPSELIEDYVKFKNGKV